MNFIQADGSESPYAAVDDHVLDDMDRETVEAKGLPNQAFTDPAFLALEKKYLFSRSWVFAGPLSDIPDPGDVKCIEVAGRQLFKTRDRDGATRVYFNVCPHRGARLVIEDQKKAAVLTCPYHGWSFGLEGALRARPHYHGPLEHDKQGSKAERDCLFEVRSAIWHDWLFVNIDGQAPAFEDYMAPAIKEFERWNLGGFRRGHYQPFEFHANWKLVVENFCDNYHVFMVHPDLHDMQAPRDRFGMRPDGVHMFNHFMIGAEGRGLTVDPDGPMLPDVAGLPDNLVKASPFCNIFPNATMAIFPSNLELFMFEPVGVDKTIMHVWFYFAEEAAEAPEHREARDALVGEWVQLNDEDSGICRRLQEGRTCDAYDGGRFAPYWDAGTLHFHRQIAEAIRGIGAFQR
jgi:choline monooxygenase